jgi:hypothetical protein
MMQRLKKGTARGEFLVQKKLKKRHQTACIFWDMSLKLAYKIG